MNIMSFNTQHCLSYTDRKIDFELMANTIKKFDPDIVGLNEIRSAGKSPEFADQTKILSELSGIQYYYFAKAIDVPLGGPYGNAILSKYPIVDAETVMIPDPEPKIQGRKYETRCVLKVRLENGLTVLVTHFGLNPDEQINAVKTLTEHLQNKRCILMGDFNVPPSDPVLFPIREMMTDTADIFVKALLSFPSYAPNTKIDYIFVSHDIKIDSADIPNVVASDHRPHIASISLL